MTEYCPVRLDGFAVLGDPAPLPPNLLGLRDYVLADLGAHIDPVPADLEGLGYWPVERVTPAFDPDTHRASGAYASAADPDRRVVILTAQIVPLTADELAARLDARRVEVCDAIDAERERRFAAGAPYGGKRIDVSDHGRADLGGMVSAAILATAGTVPWSSGYAQGWITMDNSRIPLPTPQDGITLAAAVGDWYGRTMQHARTLKDDALSSDDPGGIDVAAGWPE